MAATVSTAYVDCSEAQENAIDEITVTGTRIRRDDFNSPTPTTVIGADYLGNLGLVNVGDALTQLPANLSSYQPSTTGGNSNYFIGSTIPNLRGLNGFFAGRTLTLVDGRRHAPTNEGDSVTDDPSAS